MELCWKIPWRWEQMGMNPSQSAQERDHWLPRYLSIYNRLRKQSDLGGRSPQQRLNELLC
jgi:hypothetical protein